MFTIVDIITIAIIVILLLFLLMLILIERSFKRPHLYLRLAILSIIIIAIIQELIFLKIFTVVLWVFPAVTGLYFIFYPLIYLYSRGLVFDQNKIILRKMNYFLALPAAVVILISVLYYPLDATTKAIFVSSSFFGTDNNNEQFRFFQYMIFPVYYAQTIFYSVLILRLYRGWKKGFGANPEKSLLGRSLLFFIISILTYELLLIINSVLFSSNVELLWTFEQLLSFFFLIICVYIGLKQSLIVVQTTVLKYSVKLQERDPISDNSKSLLETEKQEIRKAIEQYFNETRIYLDPNLKIENLARKMHITSRRISRVINEVYEVNFNTFINEYRLSEAKKLMSQNPAESKIENIYTKVGFNSRSAFNHAFKESTGHAPSDYLKSLINPASQTEVSEKSV